MGRIWLDIYCRGWRRYKSFVCIAYVSLEPNGLMHDAILISSVIARSRPILSGDDEAIPFHNSSFIRIIMSALCVGIASLIPLSAGFARNDILLY